MVHSDPGTLISSLCVPVQQVTSHLRFSFCRCINFEVPSIPNGPRHTLLFSYGVTRNWEIRSKTITSLQLSLFMATTPQHHSYLRLQELKLETFYIKLYKNYFVEGCLLEKLELLPSAILTSHKTAGHEDRSYLQNFQEIDSHHVPTLGTKSTPSRHGDAFIPLSLKF